MSAIEEMRTVITVDDFETALHFYRDVVGLPIAEEWDTDDGHGVLFEAGRATLELFDRRQKDSIDALEAGRSTPGDVRIAFEVADVDGMFHDLAVAGAPVMSHPLDAPWGDRIARMQTPHGMQLTLFATG